MAWKNTISFNQKIAGTRWHMCLQNTRKGFGIPAKYPTAWSAWSHTQRHSNRSIPALVDVPLFYKFSVGGVNKGHINVRLKNGTVWSDGKIYKSLAEFEAKNSNVHYVGWGESINGVRVIKNVVTKPVVSMPRIGSKIQIVPVITRTTYKKGTNTVAGHIHATDNTYIYIVRGYDRNRVIINTKSGGGDGVALALSYTNGKRIEGWKQV